MTHNHPRGLPPSISDINALVKNKNASGITVGHDGSMYYYTRPNKEIQYTDYTLSLMKYSKYSEITSIEKALFDLQEKYGFTIRKL